MRTRAHVVVVFVAGLLFGWSTYVLSKQLGAHEHPTSVPNPALQEPDSRNFDIVVFSAFKDTEVAFRIERKTGRTFGVSGFELVAVKEEADPPDGLYELKASSAPGRTRFSLIRLESLSGRIWTFDDGTWKELKSKIINN